MSDYNWQIHNPEGKWRVMVTKNLPGDRWLRHLIEADCRVEVCLSEEVVDRDEIKRVMADNCQAAIGQLTEKWDFELLSALKEAGGIMYSNYAVGYNNVDIPAATELKMPVGNTPGVLTETTAEMAVTLTMACARRVVEADKFMRAGKYKNWLPNLFLGYLMKGCTVGVIGAGRIGSAYAKMMVEGFKANLLYYDFRQNQDLENYITAYGEFLKKQNQPAPTCRRAETMEELLAESDVVSIHTVLDDTTFHLIDKAKLDLMKKTAILVNTARGPVIDEAALVEHCRNNPDFKAGLDVFEDEPAMKPGLVDLDNVVIPPHIASGTIWTRSGMATLAALNVRGILNGYPVWSKGDIGPFLEEGPPPAAPSIVNVRELGLELAD